MIRHTGVTQETMEIIDPNDIMISASIIKASNETAHDRLVASRDTSHEAQTDSDSTDAIVLAGHAHQVVFAFTIDAHV